MGNPEPYAGVRTGTAFLSGYAEKLVPSSKLCLQQQDFAKSSEPSTQNYYPLRRLLPPNKLPSPALLRREQRKSLPVSVLLITIHVLVIAAVGQSRTSPLSELPYLY